MILYEKVRYKNFLAAGNYWIEIDLAKNSETLIFGKNGSGKSHILDAVCFALFGKTYRNINKPTYVNSFNGKNMEVQIEFTIGTIKYRIERGLKPNVFNIIKNGKMLNQDSKNIDYQSVLEKQILGLNFKSFCQVVILGSARYVPFMELKAAERRDIIEDILDIEVFSKMNEINKRNIADNEAKLTENAYGLKILDDKMKLQERHLKEILENTQEIIDRKTAEVAIIAESIKVETDKLNGLNDAANTLSKKLEAKSKLEKNAREYDKLNDQFKSKIEKLTKEIAFYEHSENCPTCKQMIEVAFKTTTIVNKKKEIGTIEVALVDFAAKRERVKAKLAEIRSVENKLNALYIDISVCETNITSLKHNSKNLSKEIAVLTNKIENKAEIHQHSFKEERDALFKEKKFLLERQETLRHAVVLLKDGGIKSKIIKQYIPVINAHINRYLSILDLSVQFELNETFNETIKSRFKTEFSYNNFSQGQKLRIDLAIMFTWRDIAKARNSASTNLLIMDEIFDSSLDDNGTEELMHLLKGLTKDTNLFIISHNDELKDKFEHQIQFELKKDYSYMVTNG